MNQITSRASGIASSAPEAHAPIIKNKKSKVARMLNAAFTATGICAMLFAGSAKAQIYYNNFEGITAGPGNTADNGGVVTNDPDLLVASSSWLATNGTFTTFTGSASATMPGSIANTGSAPTALALSNSAATSQTWTLTIPMASCRQASINHLSYQYRSTSTSYNAMTVTVNGTTAFGGPITNGTSFISLDATGFTATATSNVIVTFTLFNLPGHTSAGGGTFRLDNLRLYGTTSAASSCTGPISAGTISPASSSFCGSASTTLNVTGTSTGCGISTIWQSSPNGSTWTTLGTTGNTLATGTITSTTHYRSITKCGALADTTAPVVLTINALPAVGAIVGLPSAPLVVGSSVALSNPTAPGGFWGTTDHNIANFLSGSNLTGVFGGTTDVTYTVVNGTTGCSNSIIAPVNVVWPNTLALYAGHDGTSTAVIPVPNETVGQLKATGFGATTPCGDGGLSGLTMSTAITTYNSANPHVSYMVYPNASKVLNINRIHATARVSGTGPAKARIAYRAWSNGTAASWTPEAADVAMTSSSCGVSANQWDFNTGNTANPNPTINGITDSLEVAVFPFAAADAGGVFQLNTLEVYGIVTGNASCNAGSINTTADSALPSIVHICDSGSRFLNYNIGTGGLAGVGIAYQWQKSTNGTTWSDVSGATGVVYQTPNMHVGTDPAVTYYRVKVRCTISHDSTYSAMDTVTLAATPANAGTITGDANLLPAGAIAFPHVKIGNTSDLSSTVAGGTWSSNDISVMDIDPSTGVITPMIPGDAIITYRAAVNGCFGSSKDTIISYHDGAKALYVGRNGNSTNVYKTSDISNTPVVSATNFTTAATCGNGGISGLVNTSTAFNGTGSTTNGIVKFTLTATTAGGFTVDAIHATVRQQLSSDNHYHVQIAYKPTSGSTWTAGGELDADHDDCGYSVSDFEFDPTTTVNVTNSTSYDFAVFAYQDAPASNTSTIQINTIEVLGSGVALKGTGIYDVTDNNDVMLFPNPATDVLNIVAKGKVNVVITSIDGKKLIEQENATSVNVSGLVSGMYLVQVYDAANATLLKTEKFVKNNK